MKTLALAFICTAFLMGCSTEQKPENAPPANQADTDAKETQDQKKKERLDEKIALFQQFADQQLPGAKVKAFREDEEANTSEVGDVKFYVIFNTTQGVWKIEHLAIGRFQQPDGQDLRIAYRPARTPKSAETNDDDRDRDGF